MSLFDEKVKTEIVILKPDLLSGQVYFSEGALWRKSLLI